MKTIWQNLVEVWLENDEKLVKNWTRNWLVLYCPVIGEASVLSKTGQELDNNQNSWLVSD